MRTPIKAVLAVSVLVAVSVASSVATTAQQADAPTCTQETVMIAGEGWHGTARRAGVTVRQMRQCNPWLNELGEGIFYPGDILRHPPRSITTTTTTVPVTTTTTTTTTTTPPQTTTTTTTTPPPDTTTAPTTLPDDTGGFSESFDTETALDRFDFQVHHRSDHDANVLAGNPNPEHQNTWEGDHDLSCGPPTDTRTLNGVDRDTNIYFCREHLMTSMGDIDGYSTIAFSPKQTFATVNEVCWDQNVTDMGGRQWTEVIVTPADAVQTIDGEYHLAHTGPGTVGVDDTGSLHVTETFGIKLAGIYDGLTIWQNDGLADNDPYYGYADQDGLASVAIRRQHCIADNGNGTVDVTIDQGSSTYTRTVPGFFPAGARVIFEDHNYTPDKDGEANGHYTWHFDGIIIK